jgi:hypothetical protein
MIYKKTIHGKLLKEYVGNKWSAREKPYLRGAERISN